MCSLLTSYDGLGVRDQTPLKNALSSNASLFQASSPPSKLTLIGALASLHLIMSTRRWVWELYMLPRTLNLDAVFEWFYLFPILKNGLIFFILMRLSLFHCWYCEAFVPLKGTPWTYIYTVPVGIVFRTGDVNSSPPKAFCIPQLPLLFWANN